MRGLSLLCSTLVETMVRLRRHDSAVGQNRLFLINSQPRFFHHPTLKSAIDHHDGSQDHKEWITVRDLTG